MTSIHIRTPSRFPGVLIIALLVTCALPALAEPVPASLVAESYPKGLTTDQRAIYCRMRPESRRMWSESLQDLENRKREIFRWQRFAVGITIGAAAPWTTALTGILITATPMAALALTGITAAVGVSVQTARMVREYSQARNVYDQQIAVIKRYDRYATWCEQQNAKANRRLEAAGMQPLPGVGAPAGAGTPAGTVTAPAPRASSGSGVDVMGVDMQD